MAFEHDYELMVKNLIEQEPEWLELCYKFYVNADQYWLDQGELWEIDFRTLFLSEYQRTESITVGYLLAQIHHKILHREIESIAVQVAGVPLGDAAKDENNAILSKMHPPFKAQFWGKHGAGHGREDGSLEWDEHHEQAPINSKGISKLPLEVGYCSLPTVYNALCTGLGIARWVYGSKFIYAFYKPSLK